LRGVLTFENKGDKVEAVKDLQKNPQVTFVQDFKGKLAKTFLID